MAGHVHLDTKQEITPVGFHHSLFERPMKYSHGSCVFLFSLLI